MATKVKLIADNVVTAAMIDTTATPTFGGITVNGDATVTGDLNITGNLNSYNVTDLDVTDQTITLGAGQTEALSGGSGIIVDGSNASILWDETNTEWDFNNPIQVNGTPQMLLHLNRDASTPGIKFTNGGSTSGTYGYMIADENEFGFGYYDGTSSSTKVLFDAEGNVLIGSDSGDAFNTDSVLRLQKSGQRVFQQFKTDTDQNAAILFGTTVDDVRCAIEFEPANDALTFSTGNNIEGMRIDSSGNITMSGSGALTIPKGTTAQRPSSPTNGMIRYNTTLDATEEYRDGTWVNLSAILTATGGTITTSGNYKIHTFTTSGTFEITSGTGEIEFLVIAGGGGASGRDVGGGGGAGGYRSSVSGESSGGGGSAETALTLGKGSYTVTVGAGGAGGTDGGVAAQGNDSVFHTITSVGGGGGRSYNVVQPDDAGGGSGGGGAGITYLTGGSGTTNQGYDGGAGISSGNDYGGGGGGGASEVGYNYVTKAGGDGVASSITGSSVTRAGGGGGSGHRSTGNGTLGSGGSGGGASATATSGVDSNRNGTANTGGGGGASKGLSQTGGTGGSGIVIVRYIP